MAVRTFPGQHLAFVGGKAEVRHEMHMPTVLAMPEARVQLHKDWTEWLPKWVSQMPGYEDKVKATVEIIGLDPDYNDKRDFDAMALPEVVYGKHPVGHGCGYCEAKRNRVRKSMEAMQGLGETVPA